MFFRPFLILTAILLLAACSGPLNSDPGATAAARAPGQPEMPKARRSPIPVGEPVPAFTLPDQNGIAVSTAELVAKGDTVMVFYPGAAAPEARAVYDWVRRMKPQLDSRGAEILLAGPNPPPEAATVAREEELRVGILYDERGRAAASLGILPERTATRTEGIHTVIFGREGRIFEVRRGLPDITELITTLTVRPEGGRYGAFDMIRE